MDDAELLLQRPKLWEVHGSLVVAFFGTVDEPR